MSSKEAEGAPKPIAHRIRTVAALLEISSTGVRRLIASGELPHVRIGHSVRVLASDLEAYLEARTKRSGW